MSKSAVPGFMSSLYRSDLYLLIQMGVGLILLFSMFGYVFFYTRDYIGSQEVLALHYTIYLGIDYIAPWYHLYILLGILSTIYVINSVLAWILYKKGKLIAYLLTTTSTILNIFTFVYLVLIITLNI